MDPADTAHILLSTPLPSFPDGTCPWLAHHVWVVLQGPPNAVMPGLPPILATQAGVYRLLAGSTASRLKLGAYTSPYAPAALPAGAVGVAFTARDTPPAMQALYDADPKAPVGLLHVDRGVWEPKAVFDGGTSPYMHTVNRAARIDLDYKINGVGTEQRGPRFDQCLVFDDLLGSAPSMKVKGGSGLFWWFDGGAGEQAFYQDHQPDVVGYLRPSGVKIQTGFVSRVTGHDGQALPQGHPDLFILPLP